MAVGELLEPQDIMFTPFGRNLLQKQIYYLNRWNQFLFD